MISEKFAGGFLMSVIRKLLVCVAIVFTATSYAQEFKPGRYIGFMKLDKMDQKIPVIADVLIEAPDDLKSFPKLTAIVRLSLGGYKTHEYATQVFKNLKYDFDTGNLTFDEPENDLLITSSIKNQNGRTKVVGQVFVRSVASGGTIELLEESNEPDDEEEDLKKPNSENAADDLFVGVLDGQYEGVCGKDKAALQIQTMRGLTDSEAERKSGSSLDRHYGIGGRLAFKNDKLCGKLANDRWCTRYHFSSGSFNFYLGKLTLKSEQTAADCKIAGGQLTCEVHAFDGAKTCTFKKSDVAVSAPKFFPRKFNINPSGEQMKDLPDPNPPLNEALSEALRGSFYGYAHNEFNDSYIPLQLYVAPYSSTDNPHNPNQMMISTTASYYYGGADSETFTTQRFEARSFYLRPGFVLSGPNSDTFIEIVDWKMGFIRGVLYSHSFGKVGTVQLVKGAWPNFPKEAAVVPSFSGEFKRKFTSAITHWISFVFPAQPDDVRESVVELSGSFQAIVGTTPVLGFDRGAFDPYTLRYNWQISKDDVFTYGSGELDLKGDALLFWPPSPIYGIVTNSYVFERFNRVK